MAKSMKTLITAAINAVTTNALDLSSGVDPLNELVKIQLLSGTGAGQADRVFHDQRTINASSNEDLDLAGSLTDPFGATLTFVELRAILIYAATGNTNNVRVTRPASNGVPLFLAAGDGIDVPPGGLFQWACPADGKVTVTAGTGDLINVANSSSGTTVTYDVVIIGTSA